MDNISIYKDKLNDILSLVTSMSSGNKLQAIEHWNSAASQFQTIVNNNGRNILSAIHQDDNDDDDDDDDDDNNNNDHYNDNGAGQSPEMGALTGLDRRDEFSTPALDSPPASQQPTERHIASELSQQPGTFSSAIDDTSYYDESFFSPTNIMVDEMDQSTRREMDEQINNVNLSSNVAHNYFNTRDSACLNNRGSQITTTDAQLISNPLPLMTSSRSSVLQSYLESDSINTSPQLIVGDETEQSLNHQSYNARAVAQVSTRNIPSGEVQVSQLSRSLEMSNVNQSDQVSSEAEASAQLEIVQALLNNSLVQSTQSAGRSNGHHQGVLQNEQDLSQSQEIARLADSLASNVDQPDQNGFDQQQQQSVSNAVAAQDNVYMTSNQAQQISSSICNILSGGHQFSLNFGNSNIISGQQLEANQEIQRIFSMANNSTSYLMPSASSPSVGGAFNENTQPVATLDAPQRYIDVPRFDPRTGKDLHTCEICGKTGFSTKGNLKRHRNAHSGEKPYQCEQCDSRFTEKKSLKIHLRKHTGEKPYKCDLCDKVFSQAGVLKSHLAVHNELTRKFKCSKCPRVFRQRSQLSIHLKRHEGVRDLHCTRCNARFLTKGDLQRHFRTHTGERPYECETCGKRFTRQQSLNEHMNRHTGRKPHSCEFCGKTFAEMSACYKHTKTHKVEVIEPHDMLENPSQSQGII